MSKSTKPSKHDKVSNRKKAREAVKAVEPVLLPLLNLFADTDEVFADEGAFAPEHLHKSLGRIYRSWLDTREALDPDFDREAYRNRMKRKVRRTGLSAPLVKGSPTRSTGRRQTSEKSQKPTAKREKTSAKRSAKAVRSGGSASHGH